MTERRTQFSNEETPFTDERYAEYFDGEDCLFSDLDLASSKSKAVFSRTFHSPEAIQVWLESPCDEELCN